MRKTAGGAVAVLALVLERELLDSPRGVTVDHPAIESVRVTGETLCAVLERALTDDQGYRLLREVERYLLANGAGHQRGAVLDLANATVRRIVDGEGIENEVVADDGWEPARVRDRRRLFGR